MPKFSITTLTTGASALVVQLAMLTILCCAGSNVSRLMPGSSTASQSSRFLLGALTSTRLAPASRWAWAPARRGPAGAVDHQVDAEGLPVRQRLHRVEVGDLATADDEAAVFRRDFLGPAAVVGVDLEERCQGRTSLISEMDTGTNKLSLSATLINDRPMRPKP